MESQIARFMGSTWGLPGSCRPQVGPMLAPWTLLSGLLSVHVFERDYGKVCRKKSSLTTALKSRKHLRFNLSIYIANQGTLSQWLTSHHMETWRLQNWRTVLTGKIIMITSSNGNIFRATGPLCGEFTGPRWLPCTQASDAELWGFLWSAPE